MAISQKHVKKLESITADLGDLIRELSPCTIKEWDAFDGAVAAHKNLRKLDTDSLRQMELPMEAKASKAPKSRKDCPKCAGSGLYRDPNSTDHEPRPCNCKDVDTVAWPQVKKEWEEALQPVEA